MTTIKRRKPNRFEMAFLFTFHGVLSAGVLLTYVSEDDIYFLHQFAGYVVGGALLARLLAALVVPKGSPLNLSLPKVFAKRQGGRNPLLAWMAVILIALTGAAVLSGLLAERTGLDGLHEALAEGVLPLFIFAHAAIVLWKPLQRKVSTISANDLDRALAGVVEAVAVGVRLVKSTARRLKPSVLTSSD